MTALDRAGCDITLLSQVKDVIASNAPDLVINAAAYTDVDRAEAEPLLAATINATGAYNVALAARNAGARCVYLSTDFVFDGAAGSPYPTNARTNPLSAYGRTKLGGENAVKATDPDSLIVRTAWVYSMEGRNFLRTMLRLMGERDLVGIVADQFGTPTSADSLAKAVWSLGLKGARGVHHFTDAGSGSWYDFAVAIQEEAIAAGILSRRSKLVPIPSVDFPSTARRPSFSVLDKSRTWELLGACPPHWRVNLRASLHDAVLGQPTPGRGEQPTI